jgi:hypothetical protein
MSKVDESKLDETEVLEDIEAMFVQTASGVRAEGNDLVLGGCAPSTLYFSDRPNRVVGHLGTSAFVSLWSGGENSFAEDPPNAVLAFVGEGDSIPADVVGVIRDPRLDGASLRYSFEVLEGAVPAAAGPCTLFIDPFGRPLSPVSVAGVSRRSRRRATR